MKLPPSVWGPYFWLTIHTVALAYPKEPSYSDKKSAKEFFESLQFLLPCPVCREHLKDHLRKKPLTPHLDRRDDLFKWTVDLHNEVNKSLNKPELNEVEALAYINRIGMRNVSPIISLQDFDEIDMRSMIKGGFIGAGILFIVAGGIYYFSKSEG